MNINMDHATNIILNKKSDGHYEMLFPMANMSQMRVNSDSYTDDYRIMRWFCFFTNGKIDGRDSVIDLADGETADNARYVVMSHDGRVKYSAETLDDAKAVTTSLAKEFLTAPEITSNWVQDGKTGRKYSHFTLDTQTGERHFPEL